MKPDPLNVLPAHLALRTEGVQKSYGSGESRTIALKGADFEAHLGEVTMIVGPSGCGKTTLLSIIAGTLTAEQGRINVLGFPLHEMKHPKLTRFRANHVGFIFQQFNLIPTISVIENVSVPLIINGAKTKVAEARAAEWLASCRTIHAFTIMPTAWWKWTTGGSSVCWRIRRPLPPPMRITEPYQTF
jgi:putative ABC transport system ATP-binding protein